jgi:hypothetical protein
MVWIFVTLNYEDKCAKNECLSQIWLFSIPDPGSELSPSRIRDPNCLHLGSRIRTVSIPEDPNCLHAGSRILIKEFKNFNPKKSKLRFLSSKNYDPDCLSRIRMLTFSHPGSRGQKGTQSRILIRNTETMSQNWVLLKSRWPPGLKLDCMPFVPVLRTRIRIWSRPVRIWSFWSDPDPVQK